MTEVVSVTNTSLLQRKESGGWGKGRRLFSSDWCVCTDVLPEGISECREVPLAVEVSMGLCGAGWPRSCRSRCSPAAAGPAGAPEAPSVSLRVLPHLQVSVPWG